MELPVSDALAAAIVQQRAAVAANPLGSQTRSLGQNIDALFAILDATVVAVRALEQEVQQLRGN